jgi:amiloride-sensitive sodium channel
LILLFFLDLKNYWQDTLDTQHSTTTLTENGYCRTYNAINRDFIFRNNTVDIDFKDSYQMNGKNHDPYFYNFEKGYTSKTVVNYPLRSFFNGFNSGLKTQLMVNTNGIKNLATKCRKGSMMIRIILHHPAEVPDVSNNYFLVPFHKRVFLSITPRVTKTSKSLRYLDPVV